MELFDIEKVVLEFFVGNFDYMDIVELFFLLNKV